MSKDLSTRARAELAAALVAALSGLSSAQCEPGWLNGPEHGSPGVEGNIKAIISWDPDGPGPTPEWLIVAGDFDIAGDILTQNIAAWDGSAWHGLGGGVGGPVSSLAVMDGQLYAGGSFWFAGGVPARYIARYDGAAWHGLRAGEQDLSNPVSALAVHDGRLIAAGGFSSAGPVQMRQVGAWDGSTWSPLGDGFSQTVSSLAVFRGDLLAGGAFLDRVARWDGTAWVSTGWTSSTSAAEVMELEVYGDRLIAGGRRLDGDGLLTENHLLAWDGAVWTQVGPGFISAETCCPAAIEDLAVHDGRLIAVGRFTSVGAVAVDQAAMWDGAAWSPVAGDVSGTGTARLFAAGSLRGELVLGGAFSIIGGIGAASMAIGNPDTLSWRAPSGGLTGEVSAFLDEGDSILVAGEFSTGGPGPSAHRIGRWDGAAWAPLGRLEGEAKAIARYEGQIIVGGDFVSPQGAMDIARWSGSAWEALGAGVTGGSTTRISALLVHDGALYAAGLFTAAGGVPARNIARWDGAAWAPLGPGLSHEVFSLAVYDSSLIAGGKFTSAGGVPIFHIARWDGAAWSGLARGIDDIPPISGSSSVYALAVYGGELIAGGRFFNADSIAAWNIARWNGSRWAALSGGIGAQNDVVYALAVRDGDLYAGGEFPQAGGLTVGHIARWDGVAWLPLDSGVSPTIAPSGPTVRALVSFRDDLVAGGDFLAAGGRASAYWARWGCPPCAADFTGDGLVDFADYLEFLNLFDAQDPRADLTGDGVVDFPDYLAFLNHYDAGC
ncbi:MAG: hypothetical protein IT436_05850 [Phycisphaerales bacterium]|nr:hypothetical protein [Phycisphaerales bacterium]